MIAPSSTAQVTVRRRKRRTWYGCMGAFGLATAVRTRSTTTTTRRTVPPARDGANQADLRLRGTLAYPRGWGISRPHRPRRAPQRARVTSDLGCGQGLDAAVLPRGAGVEEQRPDGA